MPQQIKLIAYLVIASGLFISGWMVNGWRWEAKYADQLERARKDEQSLQKAIDEISTKHAQEIRRISSQRDAAIDRLRNRPERLPEDSRANCKGATGAELSIRDSEFLIREAARADETRAEMIRCHAYADKLQELNR